MYACIEDLFGYGAPGGIRTRDLRLSRLFAYKAAAITGLSHRGFTNVFHKVCPYVKSSLLWVTYRVYVCKSHFKSVDARPIDRNKVTSFLFLSDRLNTL